jgi:hypothetical protein
MEIILNDGLDSDARNLDFIPFDEVSNLSPGSLSRKDSHKSVSNITSSVEIQMSSSFTFARFSFFAINVRRR